MLELENIHFRYPHAAQEALRGVDLRLEKGKLTVLLGCNGSGKSTVAKICNAMIMPDEGRLILDGRSLDELDVIELRRTVGVVAQNPDSQILSATVEDEVAFGPENLGLPREEIAARVKDALKAVGLSGYEKRDPNALSGGEKQRLVIAAVLAMKPGYIVFDEPCSMLDAKGCQDVRKAMRDCLRAACGLLHITHELDDCFEADEVLLLDEGRILRRGSADEILLGDEGLIDDKRFLASPMLKLRYELIKSGVVPPKKSNFHGLLASCVVEQRGQL